MRLSRAVCLFLAASLASPALAGASGYWVPSPTYNAHYCPSATSVAPGGTVNLAAMADSCSSGRPAEDLDTYKDLNGNTIPPPPGEDVSDHTFGVEWQVTGPQAYIELGNGTSWDWTAPCDCVPGSYTVKWRLSNTFFKLGRLDATTQWLTKGTITVTAHPTVYFTKPGGEDEYVTEVTRIEAHAYAPDGVSAVRVYIDHIDDSHFKGYMAIEPSGDCTFDWNTEFTSTGTHTIFLEPYNSHTCKGPVASLEVYAHPAATLTQISFQNDHTLWDRTSGVDAEITEPQWTPAARRPFAYTAGGQMTVVPHFTTSNVTASVFSRLTVGRSWYDSEWEAEGADQADVTFAASHFPLTLTRQAPCLGNVMDYNVYESYNLYIRKYATSNWCPAGEWTVYHPEVYLIFGAPIGPWGTSSNPRACWASVIKTACEWMEEDGYPNTEAGKLSARKRLADRAYHASQKTYNGSIGYSHCNYEGDEFVLSAFMIGNYADCRDMSAWWVKLCNGVGLNGQLRRLVGWFATKPILPVGTAIWQSAGWNYHQHGLYTNVYDPCLELREAVNYNIRVPQDESLSSPYVRDLWDQSEGVCVLDAPFGLTVVQ